MLFGQWNVGKYPFNMHCCKFSGRLEITKVQFDINTYELIKNLHFHINDLKSCLLSLINVLI